jgi:hypothetical protein
MPTRDERIKRDSDRAWELGREYGKNTPFSEVADHKDSETLYRAAMQIGCPFSFFDVFKYGAQSIWRERGEL